MTLGREDTENEVSARARKLSGNGVSGCVVHSVGLSSEKVQDSMMRVRS